MDRPSFLPEEVSAQTYAKWIKGQVRRHFKRDNKRWGRRHAIEAYEAAIREAVERSQGFDVYTGQNLDWHLIGLYRSGHKRLIYRRMPTVDHDFDETGAIRFAICSWTVNDCKSDLTVNEWINLMKSIISHLNPPDVGD